MPASDLAYGAHTVTWHATDGAGNVRDGFWTFTVLDAVAPVLSDVRPDELVKQGFGCVDSALRAKKPVSLANITRTTSAAQTSTFSVPSGRPRRTLSGNR